MELENIGRLYELDNDRILLSNIVNALDEEGQEPYVVIDTMEKGGMRLPIRIAIELRELVKKRLLDVENEIKSL